MTAALEGRMLMDIAATHARSVSRASITHRWLVRGRPIPKRVTAPRSGFVDRAATDKVGLITSFAGGTGQHYPKH